MPKRKETIDLEKALEQIAKEKRWYGCEEITIGFANNGHGNEICDYILMDSKGIIRCYELKVTKQDLKSKAKKSWYGNLNYLVITEELFTSIDDWTEYIPDYVGLLVGSYTKRYTNIYQKEPIEVMELRSYFKAKRQELSTEEQLMIVQSMTRSMMYKVWKYKDTNNLELVNGLRKEIKEQKKQIDQERNKIVDYQNTIWEIEHYLKKTTSIKIKLHDVAEHLQASYGVS